jgi:hypothetical protein
MSTDEQLDESPPATEATKAHVSYSSFTEWLGCGKRYQLKRILGLSEKPAWWNIGGHAVHAATEASDRAQFALVGY